MSDDTADYGKFVFVLAPTVLVVALMMCVARLIFVYCSYRREREALERQRQFAIHNAGFYEGVEPPVVVVDPPPRYDTIFKPTATETSAPPEYSEAMAPSRMAEQTSEVAE